MDLTAINARLNERRIALLADSVAKIEAAIDAGEVPNKLFTDAKFIINRAVDEAAGAYDKETNGYGFDVLIMGAYNLPAALKEATKKKAAERAAFLSALLPLNDLLQSAKPLIVKRGDKPKVVTPKQAAKLARSMTCQCCGRSIFAETGKIAHHGYERPGGGWQTASCSGARELPFEVSRDALGFLIKSLKAWEGRAVKALADVAAERVAIVVELPDYSAPRDWMGGRPTKHIEVTRDTFETARAENAQGFQIYSLHTFDNVKDRDVGSRKREIDGVREEIKAQQARFDGWKQTHEWDVDAKKWKAV